MQHKSGQGYLVKADESTGFVEAFVSIFGNVDSYNERVMPGAFAKSLAWKLPKVVWAHDFNRFAGKVVEAREVFAGDESLPEAIKGNGGLWVKAQFNINSIDGKDLFEHVKFGSVDEWSFGFEVVDSKTGQDNVKELTELKVFEISPVLVGANPKTVTTDFKSLSLDGKLDATESLLEELVGHTEAYADMRVKAGRVISEKNRRRLQAIAEMAGKTQTEIIQILRETEKKPTGVPKADARLRLKALAQRVRIDKLNKETQS